MSRLDTGIVAALAGKSVGEQKQILQQQQASNAASLVRMESDLRNPALNPVARQDLQMQASVLRANDAVYADLLSQVQAGVAIGAVAAPGSGIAAAASNSLGKSTGAALSDATRSLIGEVARAHGNDAAAMRSLDLNVNERLAGKSLADQHALLQQSKDATATAIDRLQQQLADPSLTEAQRPVLNAQLHAQQANQAIYTDLLKQRTNAEAAVGNLIVTHTPQNNSKHNAHNTTPSSSSSTPSLSHI